MSLMNKQITMIVGIDVHVLFIHHLMDMVNYIMFHCMNGMDRLKREVSGYDYFHECTFFPSTTYQAFFSHDM